MDKLKTASSHIPKGMDADEASLSIPMVDTGTYFYGTFFVLYDIIVIVGKVDTLTGYRQLSD